MSRRALQTMGESAIWDYQSQLLPRHKHSFASDALEAGIGMEHIRKMLGHSDPRSTERYARLSDDSLNVFADSDRKRR